MIQAGQLVETRRPSPARVLQALGQLAAFHVSLDLNQDNTGISGGSYDVGPTARLKRRLASDHEQWLTKELIRVCPEEILNLTLIEIRATGETPKRLQLINRNYLVERHSRHHR